MGSSSAFPFILVTGGQDPEKEGFPFLSSPKEIPVETAGCLSVWAGGVGGVCPQTNPPWTVPRAVGLFTKRKMLFRSLIYIIYLERNVFAPALFSEEGHLGLIAFIIFFSLGSFPCTVLCL